MLDPKARDFLDYVASLNRPPIETIPLPEARALFEETFSRLGGPPVEVGSVRDVEAPGPRGPIVTPRCGPHQRHPARDDGEPDMKTTSSLVIWQGPPSSSRLSSE